MLLYNNGTDVVDAISHLSSLTLGTPLSGASVNINSATVAGDVQGADEILIYDVTAGAPRKATITNAAFV
jgi:hypothetical protein